MANRFLGLLAALLATLPTSPVRADSLAPGEPFPILRLPLSGGDGKKASIESFRGRKLMLHLFASW